MCICSEGYYYSGTSLDCALCDSSCLACVDAGPFKCSQCRFGVTLLTPPASVCACSLGFFPTTPGSCQFCASLCLTCDGPTSSSCLSCPSGSGLTALRSCECIPSFYRQSLICNSCGQTCKHCKGPLNTDCEGCWDNAVLQKSGTCICQIEFFSPSHLCIMSNLPRFMPILYHFIDLSSLW